MYEKKIPFDLECGVKITMEVIDSLESPGPIR